MRIIGIDPGYDRAGVAIIEKNQNQGKEVLIFSTCITTPPNKSFTDRLLLLGIELEKILELYHPDEAAIEALYFSKNTKTALKVAQALGVIQYLIAKHNIPLTEYHPNTIKLAITGHGSADKKAILSMLPRLIQLPDDKKLDDELDAIAVALTHSAHKGSVYPQK